MLHLNTQTPVQDGFYIDGGYSLAIVTKNDYGYALDTSVSEFTFTPNPTDIDDDTMFPNVIQPDHADGFHVELNEVGVKTINIRGTTGQKPGTSTLETVLGDSLGGTLDAVAGLLGITEKPTGYSVYMDLKNFFATWLLSVRSYPDRIAMIFVNHKDAELYKVLPMNFRKTRTAARPLHYGYSITLRVIEEFNPSLRPTTSWLDRMESIRGQVAQWQQAVNQTAMLSSYAATSAVQSFTSTVSAPLDQMTNFFNNLNDGMQGLVYTANAVAARNVTSMEGLRRAATDLFSSGGQGITTRSAKLDSSTWIRNGANSGAVQNVVPPTRAFVAQVFLGLDGAVDAATSAVSENASGGVNPGINLSSPLIDQYSAMLELQMSAITAIEGAPLSDYEPEADASGASRHMHETARAGAAGVLDGQTETMTSATYAAESTIIDGVRHPSDTTQGSAASHSLAYIASQVLGPWSRGNARRMSPELSSFRRGFLGMRDPSTLSPLYRIVDVSSVDTVESLASKYLGSWSRWFEIVLLNDLRYPYISKNGGEYCRKPGESIYVPTPDAKVPIELIERLNSINTVHDKVALRDAFLGFDIEIGKDGDSTYEKFDYAHITGPAAFAQEMAVALEGYGGMSFDRAPGPNIRVGTKNNGVKSMNLWASFIRQWLQADPRVHSILAFKVYMDGDQIYYYTKIRYAHYDDAVVVADSIRVGR